MSSVDLVKQISTLVLLKLYNAKHSHINIQTGQKIN